MTVYTPTAVTQFANQNPTLGGGAVSATAVAASTVLNTVVVTQAGNYQVFAASVPGGSGTIANTDAGNVLLKKNGVQVAVVPQLASATAPPLPLNLNLALNAGDTLTLTVGGTNAAPLNVYYASVLTAQQVA
jgi:hypothetical protein